jgi:hypothetical protein
MDRVTIEDHLLLAERHVARSEEQVLRQQELVTHLEKLRRETDTAKVILAEFERTLALFRADRDRLVGLLSQRL